MGLMLRVLLSLGLVMAALWFAARAARRWGSGGLRLPGLQAGTRHNLVEARVGLSRTAGLTVVRFGDRRLLVAANERTVKVLAEEVVTDDAPAHQPAPTPALAPVLASATALVSRLSARLSARRAGTSTAATTDSFDDILAGLANADTNAGANADDRLEARTAPGAPAEPDLVAAVEASLKPASILESLRVATARYEA